MDKGMNNLTCNCLPRLDGVPAAELGRLFPGAFYHRPSVVSVARIGYDGFNLRSIVVLRDDAPILLLPLFETRFDFVHFCGGWLKKSLKAAGRLIPWFFTPVFLGVGFVGWE